MGIRPTPAIAAAAAEAAAALGRAEALIEETDARLYLPFIQEEWAAWADLAGERAVAAAHRGEAVRLFTAIGAPRRAARLARAAPARAT